MSDLNQFTCTGRLGADPEQRSFPDGRPVVNLRVAVSDSWKDRNTGERKENTLWMSVVITAEGLCNVASAYLKKGSRVALSGMVKTRKWTDQAGVEKYSTELHLTPFQGSLTMLDGPTGDREASSPTTASYGAGKQRVASAPAFEGGGMDDDIPF